MHRVLVAIGLLAACGPSPLRSGDAGGSNGGGPCVDGARQCSNNALQTCTNGQFVTTENCPMACNPTLGCVVCQPGTGTCNGATSTMCDADGSGYHDEYCDPVMGS